MSSLDPLDGKTVLIADDEPDVCEMAADILADLCAVEWVTSASSARERLARGGVDLAVLDVMGMDGLELLAEFGESVPSVILTGMAPTPGVLKTAIERKARAFIPKHEMENLPLYLRVALSVDDLDELWSIWLWRPVDLLNLRRHMHADLESSDEAEFFETLRRRQNEPGLEVEIRDGVARVTANSPPLNLLSPSNIMAGRWMWDQLKSRDDVKAVVFHSGLPPSYPPQSVSRAARALPFKLGKTRTGRALARSILRMRYPGIHKTRTFGGGIPLDALEDPAMLAVTQRFGIEAFLDLFVFPKPLIMLVEGLAVAGSFEMLLCAHYVIATPRAILGLPELNFAFPPPVGIPLLSYRVGAQRAFVLAADTRFVQGKEALRLGIVDAVVPPRRALQAALDKAERLANVGGIEALKQARDHQADDIRDRVRRGAEVWKQRAFSEEASRRVRAFLDRQRKRQEPDG